MDRDNKNTQRTIEKYYGIAMKKLQGFIPIAEKPDELKEALIKDRPRYKNIDIWEAAVDEVVAWVKKHRHNFAGGVLRI